MSDPILENAFIESLARGLPRSPQQLNRLQEADAELVRIPGTTAVLALKTDTLVEEIETGLYRDPSLLGWMTVTVNASDLAAVGAEPFGLLLNETLPASVDPSFVAQLQGGIADACAAYGFAVLGGDTNFSPHMQLGAFAVGLIPDGRPVTRMGAHAGDRLFASGPLGIGGAFALATLQHGADGAAPPGNLPPYRPLARIREGMALRPHASCCMDSSDGVLPTLDQLSRLNGIGFRLDGPLDAILHPAAAASARASGIPPWMYLAGPHGEFELLFTVPPDRVAAFIAAAEAIDWRPLPIGVVTTEAGVTLPFGAEWRAVDTGKVRNLYPESEGNVSKYVAGLLEMHAALSRGRTATAVDVDPPDAGP